ncbi:hypothetical protein [Tenacibaculum ovolyticum]|uniref:hypothetical protein n=1 Tax=Tenacibaculum ovolyticum TaxID=104270 RepID=UPI0007ECEBCA|nr:hypothetical protein [Tenacibaculum ovolyticum]
MKNILVITLYITCFTICGQEKLTQFKNTLSFSNSNLKDIYTLVNDQNDFFSIFITDAKSVSVYNFDNNFSIKDKKLFKNKRRKYKDIIGYSILENGDYKLYLKNKKNDFLEIHFDMGKKNSTAKEFKLLTDYETYLQSITINNQFYLISSSKDVNGLYFYTFNEGKPKRNKIDLSKFEFLSYSGQKEDFMPILMKSLPLLKFDKNTPTSIEASSKKQKLYVQGETVIFTLNNNSEYTQFLKVDLKTFIASSFKLKTPLKEIKRRKKQSNSYLIDNNLFTVTLSKERFNFRITDLTNKEIKKEFLVSKTDTIQFKNSPIEIGTSTYRKYNELKKTKKFFSTMNYAKPAINVQFNNNKYYVVIGGSLGPVVKGYSGSGDNSLSIGKSFSSSDNINYNFHGYMSSSDFKFIKFSSVLSKKLSHLKNEKTTNVFGKIKDYLDQKKSKLELSDLLGIPIKKYNTSNAVFKYKDFYIYIDYNKKEKSFELLKFTN